MRKVKELLSTEQYNSSNVADHKMYIVHEVCKKMQDIEVVEVTEELVLKYFIPVYDEADKLFADNKKVSSNIESSSYCGVLDKAQKPPKTVKPHLISLSSIQAKSIVVRLANKIAKEIINYERVSGNKVFQ